MEMSAVLSPEQQEGYMETITSQKKHFVSLAPYREYNQVNGNTSFILFIKNCGKDPIDISTQNISAEFIGNTHKWASRSITILSPDKLMNDLERKQFTNEIAANSDIATEYYFSNGLYDNNKGFYTRIVYGQDYPIKSDSIAATQMQRVKELVLQPQALRPGEGVSGLVVCDTRAMNSNVEGKFRVVVSVNGEQHDFTFSRKLHN